MRWNEIATLQPWTVNCPNYGVRESMVLTLNWNIMYKFPKIGEPRIYRKQSRKVGRGKVCVRTILPRLHYVAVFPKLAIVAIVLSAAPMFQKGRERYTWLNAELFT